MKFAEAVIDALIVTSALGASFYGMYCAVKWARRRAKRAYLIAAALAPIIALGNVVDPDYRVVNEAKQDKKREEDEPGDPPRFEDEGEREQPVNQVPQRASSTRNKEFVMQATRSSRPKVVWAIVFALGAIAIVNLLGLSWLLTADTDVLAPNARDMLARYTGVEWAWVYAVQATLLSAMVAFFLLRRSAIWLFGAYLVGGVSVYAWFAISGRPFAPAMVTAVGTGVAAVILAYMIGLQRQQRLA